MCVDVWCCGEEVFACNSYLQLKRKQNVEGQALISSSQLHLRMIEQHSCGGSQGQWRLILTYSLITFPARGSQVLIRTPACMTFESFNDPFQTQVLQVKGSLIHLQAVHHLALSKICMLLMLLHKWDHATLQYCLPVIGTNQLLLNIKHLGKAFWLALLQKFLRLIPYVTSWDDEQLAFFS